MGRFGIQIIKSLKDFPKDLFALLVSSFLIPFSSFMIVPFIPIILSEKTGLDMTMVGLVLGVSSLIQFGGGLVGGFVAECYGLKPTMVVALTIRTFGFGMLTASYWFNNLIIVSVILISIGAALYLPANKAYIVTNVNQEKKALFLSIGNSALNAGMALGPLVGVLFISSGTKWLFFSVFSMFMLLTLIHFFFVDNSEVSAYPLKKKSRRSDWIKGFKLSMIPMLFSALAFYLYFFFQNYMGPYVASLFSPTEYSFILLLNAVLIFFFQPLLASRIKEMRYTTLLPLAFMLMAVGMLTLTVDLIWIFFIATTFITFAEMFLFLKSDLEIIARIPYSPAIAFGFQRLSAGVGAFASGIVGGATFSYAQDRSQLSSFWIFIMIQCLAVTIISLFYRRIAKQY